MAKISQKITTCLWFDNQAEQAIKFYSSVFKNFKTGKISRYPEGTPGPAGEVMTVEFELEGMQFIALNGGPMFKFNEAVSFVVNCETQQEVDYFWEKLLQDGEESQCGWLKDKFGLSWQVVPTVLSGLMTGSPEKSKRAAQALMQMKKIDIKKLEEAYNQK